METIFKRRKETSESLPRKKHIFSNRIPTAKQLFRENASFLSRRKLETAGEGEKTRAYPTIIAGTVTARSQRYVYLILANRRGS